MYPQNSDSPRNTSEMARPTTGRSHSGSVVRVAVVQNPPPETPKLSKTYTAEKRSTESPVRPASRRPPSMIQPRDARVDQTSMEDFADFIRSTGPPGSRRERPATSTAPNVSNGANGSLRSASVTNPHSASVTSLPKRSDSSARRNRLTAREPISRADGTAELIDFIREGPPRDPHAEDPRIPRRIAPFRTTMDSDRMSSSANGKAGDSHLVDPRESNSTTISADKPTPSVNSSINSSSGLLNHAAPPKKTPVAPNPMDFGEEDMMPKRKTRRVRDPYAIDFSDEEDDDIEDLQPRRPQPIKEESLADFLRNVPPPVENAPTPLVLDTQPNVLRKDVKKKASSQSLMSRFGRNGSISSRPSTMASVQGSITSPPPPMPSSKYFSNPPPRPAAPQVNSPVNPPSNAGPRVAQRQYAARDPSYRPTKTDDLADFLRNSEPPPGAAQPKVLDAALQKRGNGFSRMFGKEKKVSGY